MTLANERYAIISGQTNTQDNTSALLKDLLDNHMIVEPAYGKYNGQVELCLVVYRISRSKARKFARKYNQEAFIYCSNYFARLVNTKTGQVTDSKGQNISHTIPEGDYIYLPRIGYLQWQF
jgi:hypothetical protein